MASIRALSSISLFLMLNIVHARFVPTFPSATTIIKGDSEAILKWTYSPDINSTPDAFSPGRALCDLMWGDQGYRVALLAQNVNIYDKELKVYFRSDYGFNSSQYYIRYRSYDQKGVVYSERFTLAHMDGPIFNLSTSSHGSGGSPLVDGQAQTTGLTRMSSSHAISLATPVFTPAASPSSIQGSSTPGFNSISSSHSQYNGPIGPFGSLPSPGPDTPTDSSTKSNGSGAFGLTRHSDSTWTKISLILWPVMIGAVMAM